MAGVLIDPVAIEASESGNTVDRAQHVDQDVDIVAAHIIGDGGALRSGLGVCGVACRIMAVITAVAHCVGNQGLADGAVVQQLPGSLES